MSSEFDWLSVENVDGTADGLGEWRVSVDRDGLEIGITEGVLSVSATDDDGQTLTTTVRVVVRTADDSLRGNLGSMIIIAMDPASGESVDAVMVEQGDAGYQYRVAVPGPGTYKFFAGTDTDHDFVICDLVRRVAFTRMQRTLTVSSSRYYR